MKAVKLEAKLRESKGKEYSHKLRRRGLVPGVIYGAREDTVPLELDAKEMHRFLLTQEGENVLVDLKIAGVKPSVKKAVVKDVQLDPVTGRVLHVDFLHISMTEKIKVRVPVHFLGISTGVKNQGGILQHILRELEVSCLPSDIPASIDLDITELGIGDSLHVRDVIVGKVEILTDPERTIITVIPPTVHKEEAAPVPEAEDEPEVLAEKKEEEEEEKEEGKEKKAPPKEEETKAKQEKKK